MRRPKAAKLDKAIGRSALTTDDAKVIVANAVADAFRAKPPTIAVIGLSGTGKSSTLNSLFGQRLPVSHSVRGTVAFTRLELSATPTDSHFGPLPFVFMDAPGLGEDLARDPEYLEAYDRHLRECDVILWVVSARNRALALDQTYLKRFSAYADRMVLGINQVDLVHPNDWDCRTNLPSPAQTEVLQEIADDRSVRLSSVIDNRRLPVALYSAAHRWRLIELLNLVLSACQTERRFMFDMLSHIKPADFMPASLSDRDRRRIKEMLAAEQRKESRRSSFFSWRPGN